jgi:hypothetical protein
MEAKMDGRASEPWKEPGVSLQVDFLKRMQRLATPTDEKPRAAKGEDAANANDPLEEIHQLLSEEHTAEAFFLARRMAAEGVSGAVELVESIREEMPVE